MMNGWNVMCKQINPKNNFLQIYDILLGAFTYDVRTGRGRRPPKPWEKDQNQLIIRPWCKKYINFANIICMCMLSWGKTCCGGCESRQKPLSLVREFTQPRPKKGARKSAPRYCTVLYILGPLMSKSKISLLKWYLHHILCEFFPQIKIWLTYFWKCWLLAFKFPFIIIPTQISAQKESLMPWNVGTQ